jgi:hypothetical protein
MQKGSLKLFAIFGYQQCKMVFRLFNPDYALEIYYMKK